MLTASHRECCGQLPVKTRGELSDLYGRVALHLDQSNDAASATATAVTARLSREIAMHQSHYFEETFQLSGR
jgi:hypothetical protein